MTWSFDDKLPIYLQIIRILKSWPAANISLAKSCPLCGNWP